MIVDVLRHGELEGGIKYRGHTEASLTVKGREDMDKIWQNIRSDVDVIISSPLSRCSQAAQEWGKEANINCIIEPNIIEMYYGAWEGLTKDEITLQFPGMLEQWRNNPEGMQIPNAETVEQLQARIVVFWKKLCRDYTDKHVLIVAHSGSSRMLLAHILSAPIAATRRIKMPYAAWSRVNRDQRENSLMFMNRMIDFELNQG